VKVVITDVDFPSIDNERRELAALDAEVILGNCRTEDETIALCSDADGIICQYAPFTRRVIEALPRARVIARYGVGVDTIDVAAATERGVWVCNVQSYCTTEVAEHATALILALHRRLFPLTRDVLAGGWNAVGVMGGALRLSDLTLGLLGVGAIGRAVAQRARALGLDVIAYDPFLTDEAGRASEIVGVSLGDLFERSDFLSVHCPLNADTYHVVNADRLARMKSSAFVVNTARGALVDHAALTAALQAGRLAGAALDVHEPEPLSAESPLRAMRNVILTPHAAYYSDRSLAELQTLTARNVVGALRNGQPLFPVNRIASR
jgi:D-3-phosphoglycerate dehydrogenase / 2-oxoglutarate reductase